MIIGGIHYKGTGEWDHSFVSQLAKSFRNSYELINTKFDEITNKEGPKALDEDLLLTIAANTNLALSCELILKALVLKYKNKNAKGHSLCELLEELDIPMQKTIEQDVISSWTDEKNPLYDFQKKLSENSLAFAKIRYVYEGNIYYDFTFLRIFNDVLFSLYEK